MSTINNKMARLNRESMKKLQTLEQEIGKILIAYEPGSPYAELSQESLREIQALEQKLDVVLIAFKP